MNINKRKRITSGEDDEEDEDMIKKRKLNNDNNNIRIIPLNNDVDNINSLFGCIYENCYIKTNKRICKYHREREQHLKKTQNKLCSYNNNDEEYKKCFNKIYSAKTMLCFKHYKIFSTNKIQDDSSSRCISEECKNKKYKKHDYCRRHFYDNKHLKVYFFKNKSF